MRFLSGRERDTAEEILEPTLADERIALEIEEEVALGWRGQPGEADALRRWQCLEDRPTLFPALHLHARLLADPFVGMCRAAPGLPRQRQRHASERRPRADVAAHELVRLHLADAGDQAEVIVTPPPGIAGHTPATDLAVLVRIRVRADPRALRQ